MSANNEFQNNQVNLSNLLTGKSYIEGEVIVKFKPNNQLSDLQALQTNLGASVLQSTNQLGAQLWQIDGMTVEEAIATYGTNPLIEYIQPNYKISLDATIPNDPSFNQLWGLNNTGQTGGTPDADIDAPEAWDIQTGNNVVVGVIDTGVDYTHPDLINNMWKNQAELNGTPGVDDDGNGYIDDIYGYDFINNDSDPFDDYGHGTHVAGTIAADGNNGIGVSGVSWSAQIMALKIFDASGSTDSFSAIKAIEYATLMGAKITNNSWGGGGYSQALYDAIAAAGAAGQLFIAAAGNYSNNNDLNPFYPASYNLDNIISVAATDHNDQLAGFSNYGATSVDLAAPGVDIYSTIPGGGYASYSGTSMATPHVTGVASLIWAQNPTLSALDVKNKILNSVDLIPGLQGKTVTGGRLNAYKALTGGTNPPVKFTGDDFDPSIDNSQWSAINGGVAATKFAGTGNSLFFSNSSARSASSINADVTNGTSLSFDLIFGNGVNGGEDADDGEDVVLEYSLDNGNSWTLIKTYDTDAYTSWTTINEAIPTTAQTNHTSFRWRQITNSGVGFDEWAIDNISFKAAAPNFGFETGNFTNWNTLGNTSIQTAAFGSNPTEGNYQALITTGSGAVSDSQLENFLGLSVSTLDNLGNGNATQGSALQLMPITVKAGDILKFDWNFLTGEVTPSYFDDFGFVAISNSSLSELADTNSSFIPFTGSFNEQTGYGTFTYQFTKAGTFNVGVGVVDVGDTSVDSGLLVDNFTIVADPVFNFSFENGDFANWNVTGNASIQTATVGSNPTEGNYQALITTGNSAATDAQLETALGLNIGVIDALGNGNATEGSALQFQPLTVKAGDILSFDWNFLTNEKTPSSYNDFGFVTISNGSLSELVDTNNTFSRFTGSFGSQTGYGTFTYQFTKDGTFNVGVGVVDVGDTSVDSGLLLDNFKVVADPVFNFGFENGNFANWAVTGNASIQTASIGSNPTEGTFQALITNGTNAVSDAQLETALGLNTGAIDALGNGNATQGSAIKFKPITVQAGDILSFDWNLLTGEGTPSYFNDFGFVAISNGSLSELADTNSTFIPFTGTFSEQTGYGKFTYQFAQAGTFNVGVGVVDVGDTYVDSGLLVDNFKVVANPLFNFGFEKGDFTNWKVTGNASVQTASFGSNPTEGTFQALITNGTNAVSDAQLETALGLNAGAIDALGNGNATQGSALQFQPITVQAGDTLKFDWNFLTGEGTPSYFNDFGFVAISNSSLSELADTNSTFTPFTGSFNEQTGYGTFTYQFTQSGTFNVGVGVVDVGDTSVDSGLLVDNFSITSGSNPTRQSVNSNTTVPQAGNVGANHPTIQGSSKGETLVGSNELNEWIYAGAGNDKIIGGLGSNVIYGEDGNDVIHGDLKKGAKKSSLGADDIIYGGKGNDQIKGNGGNDKLYGEEGNDNLWGDDGDDLLSGGRGNDQLWGGKGFDTFVLGVGEGTDTIRDFKITEDLIALSGQLTFGQLSITQNGKNTLISFEDETLAILTKVNASALTEQSFTFV